jgi:hypothetical protein
MEWPLGKLLGGSMNQVKKRRQSRRSAMVRTRWQHFMSAQRTSGPTQSAWCRQNGINPKYFSLWKSKLSKAAALISSPSEDRALSLVPVTIRRHGVVTVRPESAGEMALSVSVTLTNGAGLTLQMASAQRLAKKIRSLSLLEELDALCDVLETAEQNNARVRGVRLE